MSDEGTIMTGDGEAVVGDRPPAPDGFRPMPVLPDEARRALARLVDALSTGTQRPGGRTGPATPADAFEEPLRALVEALAAADGAASELRALAEQAVALHHERDHLRTALATNRTIGAAVGIIMTRHRLTYADAFDRLVTASQRANRKLRDIAGVVVETGALPDGSEAG
jgi:hypothetical protein